MADDLLDLHMLREMSELWEGSDDLNRLVDLLASDMQRSAVRMRECAARGDAAAVADEAHRLKGASASLAATRLSAECLALEELARAARIAELPGQIEHVLDVLEATRSAFHGAIGPPAST